MPVTEDMRALVLEHRSGDELAAAAARQGMRTMRDDGIAKVKLGLTSLVEVGRVTTSL